MFSGIVETIGNILRLEMSDGCKHFVIRPLVMFEHLIIGESIAVNGVCLTVTTFNADSFQVTAVPETLRLTNLDQLQLNSVVNLERAMTPTSRIGGHYVQGHVDAMGKIITIEKDNSQALLVKIALPIALAKYVVNKGYITLDGMSITVIESQPEWFTVTFIPHTQAVTITEHYQVGSEINIEVDMMGKYIEKLLGAHKHELSI